jgi:bifunctional non-homologous end joining protein LigD
MARRDPFGIRLITRQGNDWSDHFPLVVEAVNHLKVRSCLIDGEVVCCATAAWPGSTSCRRRNEVDAFLYAFENWTAPSAPGTDRGAQGEASILRKSGPGVQPAPGARLRADCVPTRLPARLRGIVSKRLGSRYRSGRSADWLKFKNPAAPAVKREAEED